MEWYGYKAAPSRWIASAGKDLEAAAEWIWEVLQGDFAEEQSTAQVITGTVISMVPFVDQICDVRDVVANCKKINEDTSNKFAYVALGLTLIGLFPTLGSLAKGGGKILFACGRKAMFKAGLNALESDMWAVLRRLVGPLPKHIHLFEPPYPNAAFDFCYHAPVKRRSVFVFGARNEYQDGGDRTQCGRYQARAVTSNGICLEQLGVGMIWSDVARYLIVTTRVPREHPDFEDIAWKARVVDCEQRSIYPEIALGCMPIFERFINNGIDYLRVDVDWWRDDVDTVSARLELLDMLKQEQNPEPLVSRRFMAAEKCQVGSAMA